MSLLEMISGNRVNYAMSTVGGVRRDISDELKHKILKGLDVLEERTKYYKEVCMKEQTILARAANVGILSKEKTLKLNAVGPTARASGVDVDIRRDDPYGAYDEVPFEVIVYDTCDVLARILVRVDETIQSILMSRWILENLPSGEIRTKFARKIAENEVLGRVEAPRGELLYYIKSNGTDKPERLKVRTPTLANLLPVAEMLKGGYIADIPIVLAGIDPCFACMDRALFIDENSEKTWVWDKEQLRIYSIKWYKEHGKEVVRERWKQ